MTRTETVTRSRRRRRSHFVLVVFILILVVSGGVFVATLAYRGYRHGQDLRAAIAEIDASDPDWRIEAIEARRAVIPDADNSAHAISRARALLKNRPYYKHDGLDEQLFKSLSPQVRLTDDQYQAALDVLEENEAGIDAARAIADFPRGRHPITYTTDGVSTLLRHVDDMTNVHSRVLKPLRIVLAHEGDLDGALRACWATLNLGRSIGDEPCVISQLVRMRYHREAIRGLERVLGQGEVPETDLARIQSALDDEAANDPWAQALRGERILFYLALEAIRSGHLDRRLLRGMIGNNAPAPTTPNDKFREWLNDRFPPDVRPAEAWMLRHTTRLLDAWRLPWPERRTAIAASEAEYTSADVPEQVLPMMIHKMALSFQEAQALGRCAVVAVAVERHRLRHGAWPESLAALVPDLLPAVPIDAFDGQPLRYRRLADGVVIYSVGADTTDNGGKLADDHPPADGTDLGFRLWNVPQRRQPPPPPATGDK